LTLTEIANIVVDLTTHSFNTDTAASVLLGSAISLYGQLSTSSKKEARRPTFFWRLVLLSRVLEIFVHSMKHNSSATVGFGRPVESTNRILFLTQETAESVYKVPGAAAVPETNETCANEWIDLFESRLKEQVSVFAEISSSQLPILSDANQLVLWKVQKVISSATIVVYIFQYIF
jgi:hypothetical protein